METQVKHIKLSVLLLEFGGKTVLICSCMTRHESDGCFSWSPMRRSCLLVLHTDTQREDVVFQGRSSMISSLFVLTHLHVGAERRRKNCLPVRPSLPATPLERDISLSLFFVTTSIKLRSAFPVSSETTAEFKV